MEEVIGLIKEKTSSGLVYNALISSFDPRFISKRALEFADLIKDSEETVVCKVRATLSIIIVLSVITINAQTVIFILYIFIVFFL